MPRTIKQTLLHAILLSSLPVTCWGGGLYLYELGTEDVGLAGAGNAARAQDASVMASNPAGLTLLDGDMLTAGIQGLYGDSHYHLDSNGQNPGNVIGWFPGMSAFYSHSIDDRLKVGVGVYGNFGLAMDFGNWAGQRALQQNTLLGMTIQPSVAYRLDEHWSIGGSIMANYGVFSLSRNGMQGKTTLDDSDWSSSVKLGVLYQFDPHNRIGLSYTSHTRYEFSERSGGALNQGFPVSGSIHAPQQVLLSGFHQLAPQWAVMGNLGWQDWSAYNDNQLFLGNYEAPLAGKMQDTWHAAVGLQYQATPALRLNTGIAYDSSFYRDQNNASLSMPGGATVRLGVGAQYALNKTTSIGAAFEYARIDGSRVTAPVLAGRYEASDMYFITANFSKRF